MTKVGNQFYTKKDFSLKTLHQNSIFIVNQTLIVIIQPSSVSIYIEHFLVYKNNAAELVLTISKNNCYNNFRAWGC